MNTLTLVPPVTSERQLRELLAVADRLLARLFTCEGERLWNLAREAAAQLGDEQTFEQLVAAIAALRIDANTADCLDAMVFRMRDRSMAAAFLVGLAQGRAERQRNRWTR